MIRPVVGKPLKTTSINDSYPDSKNLFRIWPNPASDFINIDAGELQLNGFVYVTIIDNTGRKLLEVPYNERIYISSVSKGFFFVIVSINDRVVGLSRLIKIR